MMRIYLDTYKLKEFAKKVPKEDSKTVLAARMLWLPPWQADWPITHAHDTEHTSRVPCQQRNIQPGSTTE